MPSATSTTGGCAPGATRTDVLCAAWRIGCWPCCAPCCVRERCSMPASVIEHCALQPNPASLPQGAARRKGTHPSKNLDRMVGSPSPPEIRRCAGIKYCSEYTECRFTSIVCVDESLSAALWGCARTATVAVVQAKQSAKACASPWTCCGRPPVLMYLKICRWRHAKEVFDEVIPAPADQIQIPALAVIHVRHDQHVKIFVGLHQGVGKPHRLHNVDVVINVAMDNQ